MTQRDLIIYIRFGIFQPELRKAASALPAPGFFSDNSCFRPANCFAFATFRMYFIEKYILTAVCPEKT
jgi:hypothetical protein